MNELEEKCVTLGFNINVSVLSLPRVVCVWQMVQLNVPEGLIKVLPLAGICSLTPCALPGLLQCVGVGGLQS